MEIDDSEGKGGSAAERCIAFWPTSWLPHVVEPAPRAHLPSYCTELAKTLLQAQHCLGGQMLREVPFLSPAPPADVVSVNKENGEGVRVLSPSRSSEPRGNRHRTVPAELD